MQHSKSKRTFGRERDQRKAFLRSLASNLILKERIITTEARAKEVRPFVEKLITRAKSGTIAARRDIVAKLGDRPAVMQKVVDDLGPRYADRRGGYTRITKIHKKRADGAPSAIIEFV
jgi:large subunit ribosomal protein L17